MTGLIFALLGLLAAWSFLHSRAIAALDQLNEEQANLNKAIKDCLESMKESQGQLNEMIVARLTGKQTLKHMREGVEYYPGKEHQQ